MATLPRRIKGEIYQKGWIDIKLPATKIYTRYYANFDGQDLVLYTTEENAHKDPPYVEDKVSLKNVRTVTQKSTSNGKKSKKSTIHISYNSGKKTDVKIRNDEQNEQDSWFMLLYSAALQKLPESRKLDEQQKKTLMKVINDHRGTRAVSIPGHFPNYNVSNDIPIPMRSHSQFSNQAETGSPMACRINASSLPLHNLLATTSSENPPLPKRNPILQKRAMSTSYLLQKNVDLSTFPEEPSSPKPTIPPRNTKKGMRLRQPQPLSEDSFENKREGVYVNPGEICKETENPYVPMATRERIKSLPTPTSEDPPQIKKWEKVPIRRSVSAIECQDRRNNFHTPSEKLYQTKSQITGKAKQQNDERPLPPLPEHIYADRLNEDHASSEYELPEAPPRRKRSDYKLFLDKPMDREKSESLLKEFRQFGNLLLRERPLHANAIGREYVVSVLEKNGKFKHFIVSEETASNTPQYVIQTSLETHPPQGSLAAVVEYIVENSFGKYHPICRIKEPYSEISSRQESIHEKEKKFNYDQSITASEYCTTIDLQ